MFSPLLRVLAVVAFCLLLYCALFLREDEEGQFENRLVALWVRVEQSGENLERRALRLFAETAAMARGFLDLLLGKRIISVRAFVVSGCLSCASTNVMSILLRSQGKVKLCTPLPFLCLLLIACVLASLLPVLIHKQIALLPGTIGLALLLFGQPLFWFSIKTRFPLDDTLSGAVRLDFFLLLGIVADFVFLAVNRKLLQPRFINEKSRAYDVAFANLVLGTFLVLPALYAFVVDWLPHLQVGNDLFRDLILSSYFNLFSGFAALSMWIVIAFAFIHLLIWPLLSRTLESMYRHHVIRNKRVLIGVACVLLIYAIPGAKIFTELLRP